MSTEDNKAALRQFYNDAVNNKNTAAIDKFIAVKSVDHNAIPGMAAGLAGVQQLFAMYFAAFPDLHFTVEDMIAEGDRVVARLSISGTQQGSFMGIPPTGKHITITATDTNRIVNGQSVEHWIDMDSLGLMQQLGVIPAPAQASR
jgi:predicted ester cyclase